jgi:A1 cistron-splicing factor AAR2
MPPSAPTSTLLFLDLPPKTFIGINLLSFNSSPNFHGIKSIPAGTHFLYSGTDASLAIRHGFWLSLSTQTHVFQWHAEEECLRLIPPDDSVAQRTIAAVGEKGLVGYDALLDATQEKQNSESTSTSPSPSTDDWPVLASHISLKTLTRILGAHSTISSISSAPQDAESIPGLEHSEVAATFEDRNETPLNFIPVNLKQTWPSTAVGRERTDAARDRSWYLGHLMGIIVPPPHDRAKAAGEVLGELQFCFLMVLTLANYSCLEQWKRVLGVLLTCRTALGEVEGFFVETLQVLRLQLQHCEDVEGGLFDFQEQGGWLRALLRGFKGAVEEVLGGRGGLADEVSEIEDLLRERYGWEVESAVLRRGIVELEDGERAELTMEGADEEDEMGEYAPVYVET